VVLLPLACWDCGFECNKGNSTSELRIARKYPRISWQRVWAILHAAGLPDSIKSTWYAAIHDVIPTNERLAAIHLTNMTSCSRSGAADTLLHRLTECEKGPAIWTWTRARITAILRVHPEYISEEWTLRPIFRYWPPQTQAAIAWIVVHLVAYRLQTQRRLSLADYMEFLKRARWKECYRATKKPTVGRFLMCFSAPICTGFVTPGYNGE
jgi:hypothetical protein